MAEGLTDKFGLDVTTASTACVEAINVYYDAVLAYRPPSAWDAVNTALEADPACPLARVLSADCALCCGDASRAASLIAEVTAEALRSGEEWTWRERQYVRAWQKWIASGDPAACFEVLLEVVTQHPSDLFAVKRGQCMGVALADGARIYSIVEVAAAVAPTSPPPRFLHGMWSFGLGESEMYDEAEAKAREGLDLEATLGVDPWLDHALMHAVYFQGDVFLDEALEFAESRSPTWSMENLHPSLYTRNWWHTALLRCEKRALEECLEIFDEKLWAEKDAAMRTDPQVQLSAFSILWRLETRGERETTRPRWEQVLAACQGVTMPAADGDGAPATLQHSDLLLDILIVRALCVTAASNPSALDSWLSAVQAHSLQLAKEAGATGVHGEVYAALARLIAELYRTDQAEAGVAARHSQVRKELRALQPKWASVGGTKEQRGVLLEALEGPVVCGEPEKNFDTLFF